MMMMMIINAIVGKGEIHRLFTQTIEIKAFEKGQKEFTIIYLRFFFQMTFFDD